jgi:orotate phosphoribosyltransferase
VGANVEAVLSIFTYGFDKSTRRFSENDIPLYTLTDYTTLIDVALEMGTIKKSDIELLNDWRKSPDTWPN